MNPWQLARAWNTSEPQRTAPRCCCPGTSRGGPRHCPCFLEGPQLKILGKKECTCFPKTAKNAQGNSGSGAKGGSLNRDGGNVLANVFKLLYTESSQPLALNPLHRNPAFAKLTGRSGWTCFQSFESKPESPTHLCGSLLPAVTSTGTHWAAQELPHSTEQVTWNTLWCFSLSLSLHTFSNVYDFSWQKKKIANWIFFPVKITEKLKF